MMLSPHAGEPRLPGALDHQPPAASACTARLSTGLTYGNEVQLRRSTQPLLQCSFNEMELVQRLRMPQQRVEATARWTLVKQHHVCRGIQNSLEAIDRSGIEAAIV